MLGGVGLFLILGLFLNPQHYPNQWSGTSHTWGNMEESAKRFVVPKISYCLHGSASSPWGTFAIIFGPPFSSKTMTHQDSSPTINPNIDTTQKHVSLAVTVLSYHMHPSYIPCTFASLFFVEHVLQSKLLNQCNVSKIVGVVARTIFFSGSLQKGQ